VAGRRRGEAYGSNRRGNSLHNIIIGLSAGRLGSRGRRDVNSCGGEHEKGAGGLVGGRRHVLDFGRVEV
jgi:hypothetical protein